MKKILVTILAAMLSLCLVLPAAAQPAEEEYPLFDEYKQYLLDTLTQDSFWQGKEAQLKADLDAATDPDAECIKNFTGTADVDQAPPGVVFPKTYEEWFAENGGEQKEDEKPVKADPGTYTDGTNTMVIEEDDTFVVTTVGKNMEGQEFELTVKGNISEEGELGITGVFDGELDLTELASEDQIRENFDIAKALYEIALKETAEKDNPGSADDAQDKWTAYIEYLNAVVDLDPGFELYERLKEELKDAKQEDYHGMEDGTMYGAIQHSYGAVSFEEFEIGQELPDITSAIGIG